jgi:hypothetical protein
MAFRRAGIKSGYREEPPVVWPMLLLILAATVLWQCEHEKPTAVMMPIEQIRFIDSVFPPEGALDVPVGSCIRITFLRPMDTATMAPKKFHFDGNHLYSLSRDSLKAVMCAAGGLNRGAEYHVVVDSGIADTAGNVMTTPYSFSFRTESGNALISAISPTNGQTDAPLDADIEVTFNQGMNTATLTPANILVSDGITGTITYADRHLVFTPDDSLESFHTYTVTLKAAIADSAGVTLGQDYSWTFTTIKTGNGYIRSLFPVDGAGQVPINANMYIQFSVAIDPASLVPDNFTVSEGVAGVVSVIGSYTSAVVFNPGVDLQYATSYTAAFHGTLTSTTGQAIHIDRTWTFTTRDTLPPQVVSTSPPDGAVNVPIATNLSIAFNKDIAPTSVSADEFYLMDNHIVHGQINVSGNIVTLDPDNVLSYSKQVTAVFDGDISDNYGHTAHIDRTWKFTTFPPFKLSSSYPVPDDGCIPVDAAIRMTYSRILDPTTITAGNFILEEYHGSPLSGTLSSHDSIVEFRPDAPLTPLKVYKMTVLTGIKDTLGENPGTSSSWRFSTKGENMLPLAIGNKWYYSVVISGVPFPSVDSSYVDSIVIMRSSMSGGRHYFYDHSDHFYRYENDTFETSFQIVPYLPYVEHQFDCFDLGGPVDISTDSGSFACQQYTISYDYSATYESRTYYLAPGIGPVRLEAFTNNPFTVGIRYVTWSLISYQLR